MVGTHDQLMMTSYVYTPPCPKCSPNIPEGVYLQDSQDSTITNFERVVRS